jgi:Ca2+-transporting ATPase
MTLFAILSSCLFIKKSVRTVGEVLLVETNLNSGLDEQRVAELQALEGKNEIPGSKSKSIYKLFWDLLKDPTVFILIACGFIYFFLGDPMEALMLLTFLLIIVSITLIQENKAERALEALKSLSSPRVMVLREGKKRRVPGAEVVRGDVIFISEGDKVPADSKIYQSSYLASDESLLTGESAPVAKENNSTIYAGSTIVSGQGIAIVESIGHQTQLGQIGLSLSHQADNFSTLEKETQYLIKKITFFAISICLFVIIFYALKKQDWVGASLLGLTLAMAILPNELPAVMSIFFALGARKMAEKKVLTRKLSAIENLGGVTVLAVDKTGTLTMNQMQIQQISTTKASINLEIVLNDLPEEFHEVLEYGILASRKDPFDPMELAFLEAGSKYLKDTEHLHHEWELSKEYPLTRELLSLSHAWKSSKEGEYTVGAKGAPEAIIDLCHLDEISAREVHIKAQEMAKNGLRVIGVAKAINAVEPLPGHQHDFNFSYLGLIGIADPVRPEVPEAILSCQKAGIRLVMITGDHPVTASSIAYKIGMKDPHLVVTGQELNQLSESDFELKIQDTNIFSRVSPLQKLQIVKAFKKMGHVVAMTGDGVNDAPALKNADIGIGMGARGTDVARESASIVLLNDDFNSIIEAIKMGRRVFTNLTRAIKYLCAVHIPIAGISIFPVIFDLPLILLPAHVALLHLLIEPASTIAFEREPAAEGIMGLKPRDPRTSLFTRALWIEVIIQGLGVLIVLSTILIFSLKYGYTTMQVRALVFTALLFSNLSLLNQDKGILKSRMTLFISLIPLCILGMALYWEPVQILFKFESLKLWEVILASVLGYLSVKSLGFLKTLKIAQIRY